MTYDYHGTFEYAVLSMNVRKFRWSKDYESAEEELVELLKWRGIEAARIIKEDGLVYSENTGSQHARLWCAEGSFMVLIDEQKISMQPGDTVEIPEQQTYQIHTGITGCIYYQAPDKIS